MKDIYMRDYEMLKILKKNASEAYGETGDFDINSEGYAEILSIRRRMGALIRLANGESLTSVIDKIKDAMEMHGSLSNSRLIDGDEKLYHKLNFDAYESTLEWIVFYKRFEEIK